MPAPSASIATSESTQERVVTATTENPASRHAAVAARAAPPAPMMTARDLA